MIILITLVFAITVGASAARADRYIPGYTDFPNALRVADEQRSEFIPGYTDFPNALRLAPHSQAGLPVRVSVQDAGSQSGFDWGAAGTGAGVTAATLLLVGGLSVSLRRRGRVAAS
jgi:hypothetical protein